MWQMLFGNNISIKSVHTQNRGDMMGFVMKQELVCIYRECLQSWLKIPLSNHNLLRKNWLSRHSNVCHNHLVHMTQLYIKICIFIHMMDVRTIINEKESMGDSLKPHYKLVVLNQVLFR